MPSYSSMTRFASLLGIALASIALVFGNDRVPHAPDGDRAEVVVLLDSPSLAHAPGTGAVIDGEQRMFLRELENAVPSARVALTRLMLP